MSEEGSDKRVIVAYIGELIVNALHQIFTAHQRMPGDTSAFRVTPDQFVGIEVGRVSRQEVQGQLAVGAGHVFLDAGLPVRRQSINDQMDGFPAAVHQFAQQPDESFPVQCACIGNEPEGAFGIDCGCRTDTLTFSELKSNLCTGFRHDQAASDC